MPTPIPAIAPRWRSVLLALSLIACSSDSPAEPEDDDGLPSESRYSLQIATGSGFGWERFGDSLVFLGPDYVASLGVSVYDTQEAEYVRAPVLA